MSCDLIVVLGGPNDPDGNLSSIARARADCAIEEHERRAGSRILPTGGRAEHFNTAPLPHHVYLTRYFIEHGVPADHILPGVDSRTTGEDARGCLDVEADALVIVTSEFHLPRARLYFERALPHRTLEFVAADNGIPPDETRPYMEHEIAALARLAAEQPRPGRFIVQMQGWPGHGKSTLAHAIASATGAVVVDHDVTKSSLLQARVPEPEAGRLSYAVLFGVADALVRQGRDVVVDSPCAYRTILIKGLSIAARHAVAYRFIECVCEDGELERRLKGRVRSASQVRPSNPVPALTPHGWTREHLHSPLPWITVDTTRPTSVSLDEALAYLS